MRPDSEPRPTHQATATIHLIVASVDRLSEGRRIVSEMIASGDADASKVRRGIHPDIIELVPPQGKERIGIGQVREIIRSAQFAPVQAHNKICLIPAAEALTVEAANALLKVLEEPPRGLQFVLLAEHPSDLLPTIVSRSRLVRVSTASPGQIAERLVAAGYPPPAARWITRLALHDGELEQLLEAPRDIAAEAHDTALALESSKAVDVVSACLEGDPVRRRQGCLRLLELAALRDPSLLTEGVRVLGAQDRAVLSQLLHDLLAVGFDLARTDITPSDIEDSSADRVRDLLGPTLLHTFCLAVDEAHRSLAVYGPVEGILLSLLLMLGGKQDGR